MKQTIGLLLLLVAVSTAAADDIAMKMRVLETDPRRLAPNDTIGVYKVQATFKDKALLVEGRDYNYYFLTFIPYGSVKSIKREIRKQKSELGALVSMAPGVIGLLASTQKEEAIWYVIEYTHKGKMKTTQSVVHETSEEEQIPPVPPFPKGGT